MTKKKIIYYTIVSSFIISLIILLFLDKYNVEYEIGVNNGITFSYLILFKMPVFGAIFLLITFFASYIVRRKTIIRFTILVLIQITTAFLIVDYYYWTHPSPILENTTSIFWNYLF
jgi:hypothetical protein